VAVEFNLARVHEAVEQAVPDRECIVFRDRRLTYRDVGDRSRRVTDVLRARGLGRVREREGLAPHVSGQDHLAIYLHNGNEYLEAMLGAYKARVAPFNVNHRYVAEELRYVLHDAGARAIVYHSAFAPTLAAVRDQLPELELLLQVPDDSGEALLPGGEWYEEALAAASPELDGDLVRAWSPDDLYLLYTGGTTGMPKGVMWRQADIFVGALGGRRLDTGEEWRSLEEIADNAHSGGMRVLPGPPFMHGAAHWLALNAFTNANTVVLPNVVDRLEPSDVLGVVAAESVNVLLMVGDAFGRPIVEEMERGRHDLSSLLVTVSGGATLSPGVKERLLRAVPTMMVLDGLGASETGQQGSQLTSAGQRAVTGRFLPLPGMVVLSESMDRVLEPGDPELGWLAQRGRVPLAYLGDPDKSARTFPELDGVRYAVPGDRARLAADGSLELFGRDSATINSGGEKIFAEEVEQAMLRHPSVADCLVAGRPSERWGEEVVALVQLVEGLRASDEDLREEAARHIARYKLPKSILRVERVQRSSSGKADYRWARQAAAGG
jgi:acyl-CoA synthetase (AMP-forming)/AMP-acid ligase II